LTSSSISVIPVASLILANASSYICTFSIISNILVFFLLSSVKARTSSGPSSAGCSYEVIILSRGFIKSLIFLSSSINLPSSFHSFSNSACSSSAYRFSFFISSSALLFAFTAVSFLLISRARSAFFSSSSSSSFLYILSHTIFSLRNASIFVLRLLL